jgi:hypothetical protein
MKELRLPLILFAFLLAACTPAAGQIQSPDDGSAPMEVIEAQAPTQAAEADIAAGIPPRGCPVTLSGKSAFQVPKPFSPSAPWDGQFWFGTEHLWTALPENDAWSDLPDNPEGYTQKIFWWSSLFNLSEEPEPALVVTGRRLDNEAPPLRFYGATHAMAKDIGEAMLSGVDFPTLGCWEVTGQYKKTSLTFVVWIAP